MAGIAETAGTRGERPYSLHVRIQGLGPEKSQASQRFRVVDRRNTADPKIVSCILGFCQALQQAVQWIYGDVVVTLHCDAAGGLRRPVEHERRRQSAIDLDIPSGLRSFFLRNVLRSGRIQCVGCSCECLRLPTGCRALGENTSDRSRILIFGGWFCRSGADSYGGGENDF